jgi:hypothetical protein
MNPLEDKSLHKLLGQWKMNAPLPPRFQEGVWRRIEQPPPTAGLRELWWSWLERVFARKPVALVYVSALLLLGLAAGYVNGQAHEQRLNAQLAAKYVQSLDPYETKP